MTVMGMLNNPITSRRNSPHRIHGRMGYTPTIVVLHWWTHWGEERHWNLVDKFLSEKTNDSCHYVVSAGEITECVPPTDIAFDMELSTEKSVSIAIDPKFSNGTWVSLVTLLAWLKDVYKIDTIKTHFDIKNSDCPGPLIKKHKHNLGVCTQQLLNGRNTVAYNKPGDDETLLPIERDFPGFVEESGFWDAQTTRLAQFRAGLQVTGAIENQSVYWGKIFDPAGDSWHWVEPEKTKPDRLVEWMQKVIRSEKDGLLGPNFIADFYLYFGLVPRTMFIQNDPAIMEFQVALNNNQFK